LQEYGFRRSWVGYDRVRVDALLEKENADFRQKLKELRTVMAGEVHQLELLRVEIKKLKDDVETYQSLENEISSLIMGFYMKASEKVYQAVKEAEQKERKAAEKVLNRKSEMVTLKTVIESIKEEVGQVTNRYRFEIEKIGEG